MLLRQLEMHVWRECLLSENLRAQPQSRLPSDRKSRPVTPSPLEEYFSESSMTGGDESDDEDLTEPDDSASDTEGKESPYALFFD
jgi:hypothetical protein